MARQRRTFSMASPSASLSTAYPSLRVDVIIILKSVSLQFLKEKNLDLGRPGDRQPAYVLGYDLERLLLQRHPCRTGTWPRSTDTGRRGIFPVGRDVVQRLGLGHPGLVGNPFVVERAAREISCPSALRRLRPLSDTTIGCCIRSFFRIAAWIIRAM